MISWHNITKAEYDAADDTERTDDKIYFLKDTNEIYKGSKLFTNSVEFVTAYPSNPSISRIYVDKSTYEGKVYNGSEWVTVIQPIQSTIDILNTSKPVSGFAVYSFVNELIDAVNNNIEFHSHTVSDITNFPINISAFTNDSGYMTENDIIDGNLNIKKVSNITTYRDPKKIKISNGMQIIFYGSSAGTMTLTLGNKEYTHTLESSSDVAWVLWMQTGDIDGSFIYHGGRTYLITNAIIEEADVVWTPPAEKQDPSWIIITIE